MFENVFAQMFPTFLLIAGVK